MEFTSAWPMCRLPVTLGGGITMEKQRSESEESGLKSWLVSQNSYHLASMLVGSYCSMALAERRKKGQITGQGGVWQWRPLQDLDSKNKVEMDQAGKLVKFLIGGFCVCKSLLCFRGIGIARIGGDGRAIGMIEHLVVDRPIAADYQPKIKLPLVAKPQADH